MTLGIFIGDSLDTACDLRQRRGEPERVAARFPRPSGPPHISRERLIAILDQHRRHGREDHHGEHDEGMRAVGFAAPAEEEAEIAPRVESARRSSPRPS